MRGAAVAIAPLLLLACGSDNVPRSVRSDDAPGGSGSPVAVDGTDLPSGKSVVFGQSLTVTDDPATTASALIGAAAGGTLSVTASDGTVFTLDVPVDALEIDTTITGTATNVTGIEGVTALHAVHFEPAGLQFIGAASLRIQTPNPIAAGHVLPFQAASDGSNLKLAIIDDVATDDASVAVLVTHFSVFGLGELVDAISDLVVVQQSASAEQQIQSEIAQDVEIRRNLLREGKPTAEIDDQLVKLFIEYQDKVIIPLVESANATCDGALVVATATSNYYYIWLHNSLPESVVKMKAIAEQKFLSMERLCEDEAINKCVASGDDTTLSTFWRNMNRWRGRFRYAAKPGDDPAQYETRAKKICKGYAYFITGGLQDFQVADQKVCDVRKPFTLTAPGVATAEFSGGDSLTGTYSASGAFNLSYAGTYTISLPAGPGEPGTMTGSSGGQIADQGGSGTETYILTPAYQVC